MKSATLKRGDNTDPQGTFGEFDTDDGALSFHSLELPWHNNETGKSCVPTGTYICVWHNSPSKGWVYMLTGTAPRTDVLIHSANFAGDADKGYQSQLLGCIALGSDVGVLKNSNHQDQKAVLSSKASCQKLYDWGNKEPFALHII